MFVASLAEYGYNPYSALDLGTVQQQLDGFGSYLTTLRQAGIDVSVIHDTPYMPVSSSDCLTAAPNCSYPQGSVLYPDHLSEAAEGSGIPVLDLTPYLCPGGSCSEVIGGVIIYQDTHHLTRTYARSLAPYLEQAFGLGAGD